MTWQGMRMSENGWRPVGLNAEQLELLKLDLQKHGVKVPLNFCRNWCRISVNDLDELCPDEAREIMRLARAEDWQAFLRWCKKLDEKKAIDLFNSGHPYMEE